ncbi:MAG: hypothetical protein KAJ24_00605 [Candidatus Aenigmarchaeota archaeon]|nr:hypothetical protein [Candidatus Aenigmarchaeota archaeon]
MTKSGINCKHRNGTYCFVDEPATVIHSSHMAKHCKGFEPIEEKKS